MCRLLSFVCYFKGFCSMIPFYLLTFFAVFFLASLLSKLYSVVVVSFLYCFCLRFPHSSQLTGISFFLFKHSSFTKNSFAKNSFSKNSLCRCNHFFKDFYQFFKDFHLIIIFELSPKPCYV